MTPTRLSLTRLALALLPLLHAGQAQTATVSWVGPARGNWLDAVNWSGGLLPAAGDDVQLGVFDTVITTPAVAGRVTGTGTLRVFSFGGNTLALSGDSALGGLTMEGGSFSNSANTVIAGELNWRSGNINGLGTTRAEGSATLDLAGGSLLGTGHTLILSGSTRTLAPGGAGQLGTLQLQGNFVNTGLLNVELAHNAADQFVVSGNATLRGTLGLAVLDGQRLARGSQFTVMSWGARTAGSEFATLDFSQASGYRFATSYDATGLSVTVTGVPFTWTGAAAGGVWDVASNWNDGTTGLPQAGDTALLGSADTRIRSVMSVGDLTGTGSLSVEAGGHLVLGGTGSIGGLQLRSGSQLTNSGRLVATEASSWVGAVLRGAGITRIEGPLTIAGNLFDSSPGLINGHTLELAGTTTYAGQRGLSVGDGATLVNQGSWVDQSPNDVTMGNFNGGTGRFLNQGTFTKASNTRTLIGEGSAMDFENTGTLNVEAGYLRLSSSRVSSTGTLNIAAGAELSLVSNNATLGGQVVNHGTLGLDGGPLAIAGDLTLQGSGLTRLKSTVSNTGLLTVEGSVDWSDGNLTGAGTTRMLGDVSFATGARNLRNGQTLEILGTVTQTGTGSLNTGGGARVVNLGSWMDAAGGNVFLGNFGGGANSRFDNAGSFIKTSAFVTEIGNGVVLSNTGSIQVQAGTLRLSQAFNNQGLIEIAAGAELDSTATAFANAGTLGGDGTVRTVASFFSLNNTGTLAAGGLNDAGTLSLIGGLTQQAGGIFLVDLGGTAAGSFDLLTVSGNASLAGTLAVNLLAGAHFNVGDSFTVMTWGQRLNDSQFASLDLSHAQGYTFATDYGANSLTLRVTTAAPVPEPGSWALMAAGLAGLALRARRRPRQ